MHSGSHDYWTHQNQIILQMSQIESEKARLSLEMIELKSIKNKDMNNKAEYVTTSAKLKLLKAWSADGEIKSNGGVSLSQVED